MHSLNIIMRKYHINSNSETSKKIGLYISKMLMSQKRKKGERMRDGGKEGGKEEEREKISIFLFPFTANVQRFSVLYPIIIHAFLLPCPLGKHIPE